MIRTILGWAVLTLPLWGLIAIGWRKDRDATVEAVKVMATIVGITLVCGYVGLGLITGVWDIREWPETRF